MSKQYKYEKFEKLSDAVKAWESGEKVFYLYGKTFKEKTRHHSQGFYFNSEYYRRIKAKSFECWAIFWKDGGFVGVVECENPPVVLSGQRAARLREVIE